MLSVTRIPDGSGNFLTLDEIVEIVNGNKRRNIKKEDLFRLILADLGLFQTMTYAESADYWRGKYDALREIVEFAGDDA